MTEQTKTQTRIATTALAAGATMAFLAVSAYAMVPAMPQGQMVEDKKIVLTPAEIRNAVSMSMDELEWQGIDVDRSSVDGIGLEMGRVAELDETTPRDATRN